MNNPNGVAGCDFSAVFQIGRNIKFDAIARGQNSLKLTSAEFHMNRSCRVIRF